MTEISCSNGDLSSTPSNRSEYFSVSSELSIPNSNEEVYHSFDEEIETQFHNITSTTQREKFDHFKIVKQECVDLDTDDGNNLLSLSNETIPESIKYNKKVKYEIWDKYVQNYFSSQESINSFDEDFNNSSTFSNSQEKEALIIIDNCKTKSLTDDEESVSLSINNTTQLNTSQMDGELSDINDIVYDSSVSPVFAHNSLISEESSNRSNSDRKESRKHSSIYDEVLLFCEAEKSQWEETETPLLIEISPKYNIVQQAEELESRESHHSVIIDSYHSINHNNNLSEIVPKDIEKNKTKIECNESVADSPKKKLYFCCVSKRSKKKEKPKCKGNQISKAKRFLSFFKKPNSEKDCNREIISDPDLNKVPMDTDFIKSIAIDYDTIPFIDEDIEFQSESFISLAKPDNYVEL